MKAPAALPGRPLYLALLPDFLFRTDPVKARYVAKAWVLTLLPSLLALAIFVCAVSALALARYRTTLD